MQTDFIPKTKLEIGYLISGTEKIDEEFLYLENNSIYKDKIEFQDTQGIKTKVTLNTFKGSKLDFSINYAGLVANAGEALREFDTQMPYSSLGNKIVYESGMIIPIGNFLLLPRGMYRDNLIDANPILDPEISENELYPGLTPRNTDSDPFAVLDNRKAVSGEFAIAYDPTPATSFYDWDNEKREDANFAFSIGLNMTSYKKTADSELFYYQEGETNAPFGIGLPAADLWLLKSRMVTIPDTNFKLITNLEIGKQQPTGNPDGGTKDYFSLDAKIIFHKKHILSGYFKKDAWGPYDWYRQFNITYPIQCKLDYSLLIDNILDGLLSSKIGVKALYRTLDKNSPANEYENGKNDYMFQIGAYYSIKF